MFRVFQGRTADEAWQGIASAFRTGYGVFVQDGRNGPTREILHAAISVLDPRQRWIASRSPPINIAFALAEVIWILAGRNDSRFPNYFNRGLPKYSGSGPAYHGAYGYRLRHKPHGDQLLRAYQALSENPTSRQVILQIWDAGLDFPMPNGEPVADDVPCNICSLLKVRNGALEWTQIMRSNDVFRGLPYNVVQFSMLQEVMAGWLGLSVGSYNHLSDSLHVYQSDHKHIENSVPQFIDDMVDPIALPKEAFDAVLSELERRSNAITEEGIPAVALLASVDQCVLPSSYRNILAVLSAEGARRRLQPEIAEKIMTRCTNGAYLQLYDRWLARCSGAGS